MSLLPVTAWVNDLREADRSMRLRLPIALNITEQAG
jgi:hypothetical protein